MRKPALLFFLTVVSVLSTAAPAFAHGSSGPDATNFVSTVKGITSDEGSGPGQTVQDAKWTIRGKDALLQLDNRSTKEITVEGYSGEPYLRIGPDGVWENQRSPATYLNQDRFGSTQVPKNVSAESSPEWVKIESEPRYAWHDHRIHWMSATLPPQVTDDAQSASIKIFDWSVPFLVDGERFGVEGTMRWVRPGPIWPWLLGALLATSLPLLPALRRPKGPRRKQALLRAVAAVIGTVALLNVVHSIDDIRALPATLGQNVAAAFQSGFFILVGLFGAYRAWRTSPSSWTGPAMGAMGLGAGIGVPHLSVLSSSQLVTTLPEWFSRSVLSASAALVVPAVFVAWRTYIPSPGTATPTRKSPTDRMPPTKKAKQRDAGRPQKAKLTKIKAAIVLAGSLLIVFGAASPGFAHARLISSQPTGGATITEAPSEIVLEFSERIETSFGGVQLFDPAGTRVESGEPQIAGSTVRMGLPELPVAGDYTVLFRIISGDSHPVESRFAFAYQPPEPEPSASPTSPPTPTEGGNGGPKPLDVELQSAGKASTVGLWISRMANYLSMTLVVGSLLAGGFLLSTGGALSTLQRRVFAAASAWSVVWALSGVGIFVFGLSVAAALPINEALRGELPSRFLDTRLGIASAVQAGLAVLIGLAALAARRGSRRAIIVAALLVALAALAPPYWGHAGTAELTAVAMASDWTHIIAVTCWVGGLAALAFFGLRKDRDLDVSGPAQRFSKIAGAAVFVVLLTGAINAVVRIRSLDALLSTSWGRLVLLKLLLFAAAAGLGWRNRNRMLPALKGGGAKGKAAFRKMATLELLFMVLAIGAATGLASTIPSDAEAASRIQSIATAFGEGQINLTVDPATVGDNLMHLYFLDETGRPLLVTDPSLTLSKGATSIPVQMFQSGPGHYTALSQRINAAGEYQVAVRAKVSGADTSATGSLAIR